MPARCVTFRLLMLATVVAVLAAGGSSAQASCGDYLMDQGPHHSSPIPSNPPQTSPLPKAPCDGPGCQKAPAEPTLPVPVKLSQPETQRLGCLFANLTLTPAKQTLPEVEHSEIPHSGHPNGIEHPPRA